MCHKCVGTYGIILALFEPTRRIWRIEVSRSVHRVVLVASYSSAHNWAHAWQLRRRPNHFAWDCFSSIVLAATPLGPSSRMKETACPMMRSLQLRISRLWEKALYQVVSNVTLWGDHPWLMAGSPIHDDLHYRLPWLMVFTEKSFCFIIVRKRFPPASIWLSMDLDRPHGSLRYE